MIKGAIFDMDGVLLDSMPLWDRVPELYLESLGITVTENLGELTFAMTIEEGAQYMIDSYELNQTVEEVIQGITEHTLYQYRHSILLKQGALELLSELKEKEVPVTVATTSSRDMAEAAFARLGIDSYIDCIFTADDVGCGKERPDIFIRAAAFMGTKPEETWIFEDALHSVITAKKAGFYTVGIYDISSKNKQEDLKKACDQYVRSLKEVRLLYQ